MGKYEPLRSYLESRGTEEVPMTFAEIERVLGSKLPNSKSHPAWWSNNPSNNVMTRVWLEAGYKSERIDIGGEKLVFRRDASSAKSGRATSGGLRGGILERLRAALGGTVHVPEGVDLTEPTGEIWDADR